MLWRLLSSAVSYIGFGFLVLHTAAAEPPARAVAVAASPDAEALRDDARAAAAPADASAAHTEGNNESPLAAVAPADMSAAATALLPASATAATAATFATAAELDALRNTVASVEVGLSAAQVANNDVRTEIRSMHEVLRGLSDNVSTLVRMHASARAPPAHASVQPAAGDDAPPDNAGVTTPTSASDPAPVYAPDCLIPPPPFRAAAVHALPLARTQMGGLSVRDALQLLTPFFGNDNRASEVVDVSQFLAMHRWYEQNLFKLQTAGVPRENHAMLLCQKLEGPAHIAFRTQCMAQNWDMTACSPELFLSRLTKLFPHAEAALTRQLHNMRFSAATMVSDLQLFRQCARHSSWKRVLDHNLTLYELIRDKMEAAKSRCLGDVNSLHGLRLDDTLPFDAFIHRAAEIAHHVQIACALQTAQSKDKSFASAAAATGVTRGPIAKKQRHGGATPSAPRNALSADDCRVIDAHAASWRRDLTPTALAAKCAKAAVLGDKEFLMELGRCWHCGYYGGEGTSIASHANCDRSKYAERLGKAKYAIAKVMNPNAALDAAHGSRRADRNK